MKNIEELKHKLERAKAKFNKASETLAVKKSKLEEVKTRLNKIFGEVDIEEIEKRLTEHRKKITELAGKMGQCLRELEKIIYAIEGDGTVPAESTDDPDW